MPDAAPPSSPPPSSPPPSSPPPGSPPPGGLLAGGLRLAVTTLTVLPMRAGRVDRATAGVAMAVAPLVGAALGTVLATVLLALTALGTPALVAAGVAVAASALLTRGLHLDGLADTVDALGSYRSGAAALDIMKKPDIGPFGVAAIALTLLIQTAALAALAQSWTDAGWTSGWAVVVAFAVGRLAVPLLCRRGVPAARQEGLGALVAGTVPTTVVLTAGAIVAAAAWWTSPTRPWLGPLALIVAAAAVLALLRHAARRLGGITGDVIGAAVEVATTVALVTLSLR